MTEVTFQISAAPLANLKFPVLFLSPFRQDRLFKEYLGLKRPGREANPSFPSRADVKRDGRHVRCLPICLHRLQRGKIQRQKQFLYPATTVSYLILSSSIIQGFVLSTTESVIYHLRKNILSYLKIQRVPRSEHLASVIIKTYQFMMYREIITVCPEIYNKTGNVSITYHWDAFLKPLLQ